MNRNLNNINFTPWLIVALTAASLSAANAQTAKPAANSPVALKITFNGSGLQSLKAGGDDLLGNGAFQADKIILKRYDGTIDNAGDTGKSVVNVDPAKRRVTRTYGWGVITCDYISHSDRLNLEISVENRSDEVISGITLRILELKFPQGIKAFEDESRIGANVDRPTVVGVDYGDGTLAAANEDVGRPLYFGFPTGKAKDAAATFPLIASSYRDDVFPSVWMETPQISRPIYPGNTDHWHLSLRVGPAGKSPRDLAQDVYHKYAEAYPYRLNWPDRRPIGQLNLSSTVPHPAGGNNQRGWFGNDKSIDVSTEAGRQTLQARLLDKVDGCIKLLKSANAQGVVIWDTEGQEYPHAMSYIGDPRHLPAEMEPIADLIFKKFRDAGLRVGICLRPQKAMKTVYGDVTEQVEVRDAAYNLQDKVEYAKKRWGCTLFYVDSDAYFDASMSPSDEHAYELNSADVFQKVAAANPDVLMMPEQKITRMYAYTAPYQGFAKHNMSQTPADVLRTYPDAFSVISVATDKWTPALEARRGDLIAGVKHGDILMFRCWYETPELQPVREIYKAAGK